MILPKGVRSMAKSGEISVSRCFKSGYCCNSSASRVVGPMASGVMCADEVAAAAGVSAAGVTSGCTPDGAAVGADADGAAAGAVGDSAGTPASSAHLSRVREPLSERMWVQSCIISSTPRKRPFSSRTAT